MTTRIHLLARGLRALVAPAVSLGSLFVASVVVSVVAFGALVSCEGDEITGDGTHSIVFALQGGYFSDDMTRFSLKLYRGTPVDGTREEPYLKYACRPYENDGFRVSGISPDDDYYVVFKGYRDADCTEFTTVGVRGNIHVSSSDDEAGRYFLPLFRVGDATPLADPGFSNLGQLNGAPCDPVAAQSDCGGYFPELSAAVCSGVSKRCRVLCQADGDCSPLHPKAVCDEQGGESFCRFADAFPLNNAQARGFHFGVPLSDGGVGLLGGLADTVDGGLEPTAIPLETYDGLLGLFDVPLETGFLPGAFGGLVETRKDAWAVIGGLSGLTVTGGGGLGFSFCDGGRARCGFMGSIQVFDFAGDTSYTSPLERSIAMPVAWRLNDAVVALFGGLSYDDDEQQVVMSRSGLLCSFGEFPAVSCQPYDGVLNGPRVGHNGVCIKQTGEVPFSCDEFLLFGGNAPGGQTSVADLMVVEKTGESYSIKPVPLQIAESAAADPIAHAFGAVPFATADQWFTFGGAAFREDAIGVKAPDLGIYRHKVDSTKRELTPNVQPVQDLPSDGVRLLHRVFHQVVTYEDDGGTVVVIVGGLDGQLRASNSVLVLRVADGGVRYLREIKLRNARFGHSVTPFGNPFLPEGYLVSGGFRLVNGNMEPVYGSEVLLKPLH